MADVDTSDGLRAWARGVYPTEAAAELLIRAHGGRFADAGWPWIQEVEDLYWIDATVLVTETGALSGGERRFLRIVGSLLDSGAPVVLEDTLPGLDRYMLALVLAAVSHAGGSHRSPGGALYAWPEDDA